VNLAIAVFASVVLGLIGTRYAEYSYWRGWAPKTFAVGVLMLLAAYALGGVLGFGIFKAVGSEGGALSAAIKGGVGHALLRVQIERIGPESTEPESRNALALLRDWIFGYLDARARVGTIQWIRKLRDEELRSAALDLCHRRFEPNDRLGQQQFAFLAAAAADLNSDEETVRADGRGRLRGYCWREIVAQRISRGEV
jgi:hypothetical protein